MWNLAHRRSPDRARRQEVSERLAAFDLSENRFPGASRGPEIDPPIVRLRAALESLGPIFVAFGRYLSSRLDLLSESDVRVLASLPDRRTPLPLELVRQLVARELDLSLEEAFASFEPVPIVSSLLYQEHRAELIAGEPVVVRLVRPELGDELARDVELLPLIQTALAPFADRIESVVADFAGTLQQAVDLTRQAGAMDILRQDRTASALATVPQVIRRLSTSRLMTRTQVPGATLWESFPLRDRSSRPATGREERLAEDLAVRLCQAWLWQALFAQAFALEIDAKNVVLSPEQRIAWTAGGFATLPAESKNRLWEYLKAAAAQEPDLAVTALLPELTGGPSDDGRRLRQRLRQVSPFRDGGLGASDDLAGHLYLHWRIAAEEGYRPRPHVVPFFRGLAQISGLARRLARHDDPLRQGIEGTQLLAGVGELAQVMDPQQLSTIFTSYLAATLTLPQKLSEVLALAAEGKARLKLEMVEPEEDSHRKNSMAALTSALLALGGIVLLAHRLAAAQAFGLWGERVATVLMVMVGLYALREIGRRS